MSDGEILDRLVTDLRRLYDSVPVDIWQRAVERVSCDPDDELTRELSRMVGSQFTERHARRVAELIRQMVRR